MNRSDQTNGRPPAADAAACQADMAILSHCVQPALLTDPCGVVLAANRAAETLARAIQAHGQEAQASPESPALGLPGIPLETSLPWLVPAFKGHLTSGHKTRRLVLETVLAGETHSMGVSFSDVPHPLGTGKAVLILLHEITRLKRMERAYAREYLRLQHLLDSSTQIGLLATDLEGRIIMMNAGAERIMGTKASDLLDRIAPDLQVLGALDAQEGDIFLGPESGAATLQDMVGRDGFGEWECIHHHPDGRTVILAASVTDLHDVAGTPIGYVAALTDITDRKKAERLREDVERMSRHDLRSPLSAVIGVSRLLMEDGGLTENQEKCLRIIHEAGYRMLHMVNQSLDLHRMEQGTYLCRPAEVDIMTVLEEVLDHVQGLAGNLGVRMDVQVENQSARPGAVFPVLGEEQLCYSILANLVENAVQASPPGGVVTIGLHRGERAEVRIANQGLIPEDIRERVFEKYVTAGKAGGTGLGTYSARLMARTLGGDVVLASVEGQGTEALLTLPV